MARTDNLNNFLTDVADAIREKKGTTYTIPASSFDTEIASIESGGEEEPIEITNAQYLFYNGARQDLIGQLVKKFKNVTSLDHAFYGCSSTIEIEQFDTSNTTNMDYAFYNCTVLKSLPINDTSKVKDAEYMAYGCQCLYELPENLDFSNCGGFYRTFYSSALKSVGDLDLGSKYTSNVSVSGIFGNCLQLESVGNLNCSNILMSYAMFQTCGNLTTIGSLNGLGLKYSTTQNGNCVLDLSSCNKLTHDSLMNVINSIADVSHLSWSPSLKLGSTNLAKLDADTEIIIATNKNWSVS